MITTALQNITAVNAENPGWTEAVRQHIDAGTNFFLILPKDPEAVKNFCELFELPEDCAPKVLSRADFFLQTQFIDPKTFDEVMERWDDEHDIVFVEQLDFPMNTPPRVKPFLIYSPVYGILAQHDEVREAKRSLAQYETAIQYNLVQPHAGVYKWDGRKWVMLA